MAFAIDGRISAEKYSMNHRFNPVKTKKAVRCHEILKFLEIVKKIQRLKCKLIAENQKSKRVEFSIVPLSSQIKTRKICKKICDDCNVFL